MTKPKLTPWFPPDVLPVRDGVYEMEYGVPWFRAFRSGKWRFGASTVEQAADKDRRPLYGGVRVRWRGLAEEPK